MILGWLRARKANREKAAMAEFAQKMIGLWSIKSPDERWVAFNREFPWFSLPLSSMPRDENHRITMLNQWRNIAERHNA